MIREPPWCNATITMNRLGTSGRAEGDISSAIFKGENGVVVLAEVCGVGWFDRVVAAGRGTQGLVGGVRECRAVHCG